MRLFRRFRGRRHHGVAQAYSTGLESREQPLSPDVFRGQDCQTCDDGQPAGTGCHQHDDACSQKGETSQDLKPPLDLLNCSQKHSKLPAIRYRADEPSLPIILDGRSGCQTHQYF